MNRKGPPAREEAPQQKPSQREEQLKHKMQQGTQSPKQTGSQIQVPVGDAGLCPPKISKDKPKRTSRKKHHQPRHKDQGYTPVRSAGHPPEARWNTDWMMEGTLMGGERGQRQRTTSR